MKTILIMLGTLFLTAICFAQSSSPLPAVSPVAAAVAVDGWTAWIQSHLLASLGTIGAVVEIAARFIPTVKAQGWFHWASALLNSAAGLFTAIAKFLDGILPQKISTP